MSEFYDVIDVLSHQRGIGVEVVESGGAAPRFIVGQLPLIHELVDLDLDRVPRHFAD